jgi:hypothetical protein
MARDTIYKRIYETQFFEKASEKVFAEDVE